MSTQHKGPPTLTQWKRFVASRQGFLPMNGHEDLKVLCLACGLPIALSLTMPIVVGSVVSISHVEDVEIDKQTFEQWVTKYMPVTAKGNGCLDCHFTLAKITGNTLKTNKLLNRNWGAWIEVDPRDVDPNSTVNFHCHAEVQP